jgi:hypothetical protein
MERNSSGCLVNVVLRIAMLYTSRDDARTPGVSAAASKLPAVERCALYYVCCCAEFVMAMNLLDEAATWRLCGCTRFCMMEFCMIDFWSNALHLDCQQMRGNARGSVVV